jgi:glycine/D-amino acid oxidase-like deaminating enzyme
MYLLKNEAASVSPADPPEIDSLYPDIKALHGRENPFASTAAERFWSMLIEPHTYLAALIRDYQLAGGKIVRREFQSIRDIHSLSEPAVVNCTGLGANALIGDTELIPVKGQLSVLLPQPEVDYCTAGPGEDLYMFPRKDGIILGGTHERGVWSTQPDPQQAERIMREHASLFTNMRAS